jgi:hypothetical protein
MAFSGGVSCEGGMTPKQGMYIGIGASVGLVVIIVVVVLLVLNGRNSIGSPTDETSGAVLKKIDLKLDLGKVITPPPSEDSGAAAIYEAAVKEVVAMGDDFMTNVKSEPEPEKKPGFKSIMDKLEEAADKGLGNTTLNFDAVLPMQPDREWRIRDTLYTMGQVASKAATSMRSDKKRDEALKASRAVLIFGDRLFNQGGYVAYKSAGLGCVSEGLAGLEAYYSERFFPDAGKEAAAKELYESYRKQTESWNKKEKLVRRIPPLDPGDLWNLAEHDEDRAWRADGLMWLGVAKWTNASGAQRSAIQKYLESKMASADPLTAQRAKLAAEFKREDVRTMRPE